MKAKALRTLAKIGAAPAAPKKAKSVARTQKRTSGRTAPKKEEEQLEMRFTDEDVPILGSKARPDKTKDDVDALQEFLDTISGKKKLSSTQQSAYEQMMKRAFKD